MIASRSVTSDVNCNNNQATFCETFHKLQSRLLDFVMVPYIGITDADIPQDVPAVITHCHRCLMQEFTFVF